MSDLASSINFITGGAATVILLGALTVGPAWLICRTLDALWRLGRRLGGAR